MIVTTPGCSRPISRRLAGIDRNSETREARKKLNTPRTILAPKPSKREPYFTTWRAAQLPNGSSTGLVKARVAPGGLVAIRRKGTLGDTTIADFHSPSVPVGTSRGYRPDAVSKNRLL